MTLAELQRVRPNETKQQSGGRGNRNSSAVPLTPHLHPPPSRTSNLGFVRGFTLPASPFNALSFPDRLMDTTPVAAIREQLDTLIKSMRDEVSNRIRFPLLRSWLRVGFMVEFGGFDPLVAYFVWGSWMNSSHSYRCFKMQATLALWQRDQPLIDYRTVDGYVHQMKGSSASVGTRCIKLCCIEFRHFCEQSNRDGCLHALNCIKHELNLLRNKFNTMIQLEQKIQALESLQQPNSY